MKKNIFILSAIILIVSASCNNSSDEKKTGDQPKTKADSLMDDVMAGHDAAMAKMNKLSVLKAKLQHSIDSLSTLPEKVKKAAADYKINLDSTLTQLNTAENSMNKWMDEFNMDSAANNMDERIKYLESEKTKVTNVRDDMTSSMSKADSLLKKPTKQ